MQIQTCVEMRPLSGKRISKCFSQDTLKCNFLLRKLQQTFCTDLANTKWKEPMLHFVENVPFFKNYLRKRRASEIPEETND